MDREPPPEHMGETAYGELFAAAHVVLDWMKQLRREQRPIAKFNRLQDAIDRVREAHQMHDYKFAKAQPPEAV